MKKLKINPAAITATIASIMAIAASVGFTGYFSYKVGMEHSIFLAILSVMFAVSLDLMKPLALHSALKYLSSLNIVKGLLCLSLALVAIIYSLTSEISLMSMSRGDLIAKRENTINNNKASQETYVRWKQQLKRLAPSRPIAEVRAEITKIESLPGILIKGIPCGGIYNGVVTRSNCPIRSVLLAELARGEKREKLEGLIADYQSKQYRVTSAKHSDPGSESLSLLLVSLFGFKLDPKIIGQWLPMIGVFGLELASTLSVVLVNCFSGSVRTVQVVHQQNDSDLKNRVAKDIVNELKKNGGALSESEREFAKRFRTSKTTLRRTIYLLSMNGFVKTTANRNGTTLSLIF